MRMIVIGVSDPQYSHVQQLRAVKGDRNEQQLGLDWIGLLVLRGKTGLVGRLVRSVHRWKGRYSLGVSCPRGEDVKRR
jgi:hypothetical protein